MDVALPGSSLPHRLLDPTTCAFRRFCPSPSGMRVWGGKTHYVHRVCKHRTAENPMIRSTLIADDPKTRKRARLSWYHPEDTVRLVLFR